MDSTGMWFVRSSIRDEREHACFSMQHFNPLCVFQVEVDDWYSALRTSPLARLPVPRPVGHNDCASPVENLQCFAHLTDSVKDKMDEGEA